MHQRLLGAMSQIPPGQLIRFAPQGMGATGAQDIVSPAGFYGFIAAPLLFREALQGPANGAGLVVALQGHLLADGAKVCIEGAAAAQLICSIFRSKGARGFSVLSGNFAFVLIDPMLGVFLVRDAAGTKPLFMSENEGMHQAQVFGSSALEVARLTGEPVRAEAGALQEFLHTGRPPSADRTLRAGVRCVPSANALRLDSTGAVVAASLERPSFLAPQSIAHDFNAATEELLRLLLAVTAAQGQGLTAASALSGGIDSSGILAGMQFGGAKPPRCFSFCHNRADLPSAWNERLFAQQAAEHCHAELTCVSLAPRELPQLLTEVSRIQDFPFGSPVVLAQAHLFRIAAASGVDRLLSGHGPDSLFGGGSSHLIARAADLAAHGHILAALRLLAGARPYLGISGLRLLGSVAAQFTPRDWRHSRPTLATEWARQDWFAARIDDAAGFTAGRLGLQQQIEEQIYRSVVPVSLITEECNARACGIDNRSPYLVREMLTFAAALSADMVVTRDGVTKSALRRALAGRIPPAMLHRKRAIGFAVPVLPWLLDLTDWAAQHIGNLQRLPFYSGPGPDAVIDTLRRNDASAWQTAFVVWRWLSLSAWIEANNVHVD